MSDNPRVETAYQAAANAMTEQRLVRGDSGPLDMKAMIRAALAAADQHDARDAEIARLRKLADAALDYIDKSPCDPDITAKQAEAWERLRKIRQAEEREHG